MASHSSATLSVALVLLGFYAGTFVVAQKGAPQQNPEPPKVPSWPAQPPPPPPQNPEPPKVPSWPARPPPQNPEPPKVPSWPARPPPQNPEPPKVLSWPARPPPQNPEPPKVPSWPAQPPPQNPEPPKVPSWPARPPPQNPEPPKVPSWPARPPPQNPEPPKVPSWPAQPPPQNPEPPKVPSWPAQPPPPPPQNPEPPKVPSWSSQRLPQNRQPLNGPARWAPPTSQNRQPPKRPPVSPPQNPQVQWDAAAQQPKEVQAPQLPKEVQAPQQPNMQVQQQPQPPPAPAQTCDVAIGQRVPCGVRDVMADACNAIGCCFDDNGCYYGKAVTVQCTKDAHFIVVVARDATLPNIDLESIALLGSGAGCTHVDSNSLFAIYHFPVTTCGSVVMEEPGVIIYENRMFSSYEVAVGPLGSITRDSSYELLFQCRYIGTSVETLVVEVMPLETPSLPVAALGPIQVELRLANGKCVAKGCDEVEAAYASYYVESDYPVTKVLREPVFMELRLLDKTDPNLVLTLGRCWTTTTPNPHNLPQWDICVDGCPYQGDRFLSSLIPVDASSGLEFPSHYKRVMFQMFTFVEPSAMTPMREQVYIHCSTAVCSGHGDSCQVHCPMRNKREAVGSTVKKAPRMVATIGPLMMSEAEEGNQGQSVQHATKN